ncbi:peptidyl-prolyl cis-trans isomerase CYP19-2-like [Brassica napus]|nr:peptidyl-prolyl cis-trans isomerase CYP19-2-like [Brassica napus]
MSTNPRVFLEIAVNFRPVGRIVIELFADTNPKTAENFRALCTGEKGIGESGIPLHYKGTIIHGMTPNFIWYGGDTTHGCGGGGESIYGQPLADNNYKRKHDGKGIILSMTRNDESTTYDYYESQFMILMRASPDLDGEQVVFGEVVDGVDVISRVEQMVGGTNGYPLQPVTIADCGQVFPEAETMVVGYSVPKWLKYMRALQLRVAELENPPEKQTVSCEMGYGLIRIGKSFELQEQLMTSLTTHRAVEHSVVARESEGDGTGHGIPEEQ